MPLIEGVYNYNYAAILPENHFLHETHNSTFYRSLYLPALIFSSSELTGTGEGCYTAHLQP